MLETLKIISYLVWIGVGITSIVAMIYGLVWYNKFTKNLFKFNSEDEA